MVIRKCTGYIKENGDKKNIFYNSIQKLRMNENDTVFH